MFLLYINIFCFRKPLICSGEENMYNCLINFEYITNITYTTNCLDYHSMPSSNNGVIQGIMLMQIHITCNICLLQFTVRIHLYCPILFMCFEECTIIVCELI